MNRLSAANISVSICTSSRLLGDLRLFMASIWSGLTSIPQLVIRLPKNLLAPTPKAHFSTLRCNLCCRSTSNAPWRSSICRPYCLLFTTMSSMYTSTMRPIYLGTSSSSSVGMWPQHFSAQKASRYSGIYQLVDLQHWKRVLWTCPVQVREIYTNHPLVVLFLYYRGIC